MKLKCNALSILVMTSFMLFPSMMARNTFISNKAPLEKNEEAVVYDENNISFDFYSSESSESSHFTYEDGLLVSTADAEQKAIVKDFSSKTVDISYTIPLISVDSILNSGLYIHAKEAGNNVDQIDAFNVQVEKDVGSDHFKVSIFEFTNGAFVTNIANTVEFSCPTRNLNIRVTADENDINVYLKDSDVPSINKKIHSFGKDGMQVGFRSMFAVQRFSNIKVSSVIEQKEIPTVKVLMVGNSYAVDTMTYCHEIAASQGVNMVCGVVYYGGCTVKQHAQFIADKSAVYTYYKNGGIDKMNATFDDILFDEDWDYITIQSGSGDQGIKSTYYPYIQKIIAYIEHNHPRGEIGMFQSWQVPTCFEGTGNNRLSKYGDSSEDMYQAIVATTNEIQQENGLEFIVASSEILHRIKDTDVCDDTVLETSFNRDSTGHLNENGRYMMGMLMYKTITGMDVRGVTYLPYGYSYGEVLGPNEATASVVKEVVEGIFDEYECVNCLVDPNEIVDIEVSDYKSVYTEGEYFDYQNIKVDLLYRDGHKAETKYFTIDIMRPLTAFDTSITITYRGLSKTIDISVSKT